MGSGENNTQRQSSADERITRLHEVAAELQSAATEDAVYNAVIDAAVETLGFDSCSVSVPDDEVFDERAVSESTPFEEGTRSFSLDEGAIGRAFQTGDSIIIGNALENDVAKPSHDSILSGLTVPLEKKGVFQGYSSEPDAFDEKDLEVAELLCVHATAALNRIERGRQLQRKNEQLERFASIVSHDLRNPMNVASLQLDLAKRDSDSDALEAVDRALTRMETLVNDLLTLAKAGQQIDSIEQIDLASFTKQCWQTVDTEGAILVVTTERTVLADRNRLRQLLENLFRNAIEHGAKATTPDNPKHGSKQYSRTNTTEQTGQTDVVTVYV